MVSSEYTLTAVTYNQYKYSNVLEYLDGIRLTFTKNSGDDEKTLDYGNFSNYNQHVYNYLAAQKLPTQRAAAPVGVNTLTPFFAE